MSQKLLLERDEWADMFEKGMIEDTNEMPPMRKGYADVVKSVDEEKRTVEMVISTGVLDRDQDIINPKKWNLKNYKKNPVVQWAHDYRVPAIARAASTKVVNGQLVVTDKFPEEDAHPFADMIWRLILGKFLNAASVGFQPERGKVEYDPERGGFNFNGQELLEHSIVNVPSNPEALIAARAGGIDLGPMQEWAKMVLESEDDGPGLWLPRHVVEHALRIAEEGRMTVPVNGFKLIAAHGDEPAWIVCETPLPTKDVSVEELEQCCTTELKAEMDAMVQAAYAHTETDNVINTTTYTDMPEIKCGKCGEDIELEEMEGELITDHECAVAGTIEGGDVTTASSTDDDKEDDDDKEPTGEQLLAALLDAEEDKPKNEDQEIAFLGRALAEAVNVEVKEAVRARLTALTGRLD